MDIFASSPEVRVRRNRSDVRGLSYGEGREVVGCAGVECWGETGVDGEVHWS